MMEETHLSMPPFRMQWEANQGYCGEASLISMSLHRGGLYMSQYDVRNCIASGEKYPQIDTQLLLGVNDRLAAEKMHLKAEIWKANGTTKEFLVWVKAMLAQGHPVAIGLFMNQSDFTNLEETGDDEYDHIVTASHVASEHPDSKYHGEDVLYFSDHGLWDGEEKTLKEALYSISFDDIQKTRKQANLPTSPLYSLHPKRNYGIAVTGIYDLKKETQPIRIQPDISYEPSLLEGSNDRPSPIPVHLQVTVSQLTPGVPYIVYRYNRLEKVPHEQFNKYADQAEKSRTFQIESGSSYTFEEEISSDQTVIYRAVLAP